MVLYRINKLLKVQHAPEFRRPTGNLIALCGRRYLYWLIMNIRSIHDSTARYALKSAQSFLSGGQNLKWISGVLRKLGLSYQETQVVLVSVRNFGHADRNRELFEWLENANW